MFLATQATPSSNPLLTYLPLIVFFVIFYFILILPEQKKQKKIKNMIDNLTVNDKVVTRGGIIGTITSIHDDNVIVESGPARMKIELSRTAIAQVIESKNKKTEENKKIVKEDKKQIKEDKKEELNK